MWLAILLAIILVVILLALLQPKPKEPTPLPKAVDDVLEGFQKQAATWGDPEAVSAFMQAREKVREVVNKYDSVPKPGS